MKLLLVNRELFEYNGPTESCILIFTSEKYLDL